MDLAAGQCRFEHVRRVQTALTAAGTHDRMEFINEKNDVGILACSIDDGLYPLFEISAVLCPRDYGSDVQRYDAFLCQCRRNLALGYLQRDSFHDCRLSDTRLADNHRIVLFPPAENLYDAGNLPLPADDRIQLPLERSLGKVNAEFRDVLSLFRRGRRPVIRRVLLLLVILDRIFRNKHSVLLHICQNLGIVNIYVPQIGYAVTS